jgi:uncharacterized membrane protein YgaE (UPF0421/DUF939 family)
VTRRDRRVEAGWTRRYRLPAWLALQATAAATAAWLVANLVHGEDQPFFAPVAAVVALTAPRGERGLKAIQVLLGVFLGIMVGEIVIVAMGAGYGRLAIAAFVSLFIATSIGNTRLAVTQAGVSAVLTVIAAGGEAGWHRLLDAAIGGGVALIFTQVIFSPEPVALLRQAEASALREIARGLSETADALRGTDKDAAARAVDTLRALRTRLGELARLRSAGSRVARRSAIWQSQRDHIAREKDAADRLELIAGGCVLLARVAFEAMPPGREALAERIRALGALLDRLADAPGDRDVRQQAVGDALAVSRPLGAGDPSDRELAAVSSIVAVVVRDILLFAGLTPLEAAKAMRGELARAEVPHPPTAPLLPFGLDRRRRGRRSSDKLPDRNSDRSDGDVKD